MAAAASSSPSKGTELFRFQNEMSIMVRALGEVASGGGSLEIWDTAPEQREGRMSMNKESAAISREENQESEAPEEEIPAIKGAEEAEFLLEDNHDLIDKCSMSHFLYNVPGKLSWSKGWSDLHLNVFWCSAHSNDSERTQTLSPSLPEAIADKNEAIKERIKSALQLFMDHSSISILVQFWAPIMVGSQIFLSTSDLPFGLNYPQKGLCLYRKHCMHYNFSADGDEKNEHQLGPPGRVFCHGVPEHNPFLEHYSIKEYPLRNCAIHYGATTYLGLPVFESLGQRCVGVLEVLIFFEPSWYIQNIIGQFSSALKAVGLRSSDISLPSMQHVIEQIRHVTNDMKEGLEMVCKAHNLPFAQIWKPRGGACDGEIVFSSIKVSYMLSDKYFSFLSACEKSHLRNGEGVVGKAFSSFTSCFCKDITRLSTNEYSLALDASKINLTSCFAICLRSSYTGYRVYIVEFFLPTSETACKEPWTFLDSLLATIKHHFRSFKIASGLELGKELPVEVIKLSEDDELDSFKICQTTKSPPTLGCSQNEEQHIQLRSSSQQLALTVDAITNGRNAVCPEQSIAALPLVQEFLTNGEEVLQLNPPYQSLSLDINAVQGSEKNVCGPKQTDTVVTPLDKGEIPKISNWGRKITLEVLEQHVGKKLDDVASILKVSKSTIKRTCRKNNISRWPPYKRQKVKHSLSTTAAKKHIAEDCCRDQLHSVSTPDKGIASNAHPIPQATTVQNGSSMTIKAKYGADMIKFELSLSSRMMGLVDEVAKRLKLQADSFKTKYIDEDNDLILLACDEDLHKCMSSMRSLGRAIVHIVIEPII